MFKFGTLFFQFMFPWMCSCDVVWVGAGMGLGGCRRRRVIGIHALTLHRWQVICHAWKAQYIWFYSKRRCRRLFPGASHGGGEVTFGISQRRQRQDPWKCVFWKAGTTNYIIYMIFFNNDLTKSSCLVKCVYYSMHKHITCHGFLHSSGLGCCWPFCKPRYILCISIPVAYFVSAILKFKFVFSITISHTFRWTSPFLSLHSHFAFTWNERAYVIKEFT